MTMTNKTKVAYALIKEDDYFIDIGVKFFNLSDNESALVYFDHLDALEQEAIAQVPEELTKQELRSLIRRIWVQN